MKKRILSLLMTLAMVIGMLPVTAFAAEGIVEVDNADALQQAADVATGPVTIKLTENITASGKPALILGADKDITLDLNGHTISSNFGSYTIDLSSKPGYNAGDGKGAGTLTITGNGTITNTSEVSSVIHNFGTLNIGTDENDDSDILITRVESDSTAGRSAIKNEYSGICNIYTGTLDCDTTRSMQNFGTVNIYGGTVSKNLESWKDSATDVDPTITIYGGTFNGDIIPSCTGSDNWVTPGKFVIFGGTFNGKFRIDADYKGEKSNSFITVNVADADALQQAADAATGPVTIKLTENITASGKPALILGADKDITLDLNGHTISSNFGSYTIDLSSQPGYNAGDGKGAGTLTITGNGTIENTSEVSSVIHNFGTLNIGTGKDDTSNIEITRVESASTAGRSAIKNEYSGTCNIYTGTLDCDTTRSMQNFGTVNIYGGTVSKNLESWKDSATDVDPTITIYGGTFNGDIIPSCTGSDNWVTPGKFVIIDGIFKGELRIDADYKGEDSDSFITVTGGTFDNDSVNSYVAENYIAASNGDGTWTVMADEVTGVTLNKTSATLTVGKTLELTATVVPAEATDKTVTWSSSDEDVATVEDGVVTAHKVGTVTITATSVDNEEVYADCVVTVEKKAASKPSASTGGSSSGSTGGSTTTTEKNPDGSSTTTQVNNATGTVTETTKNTDGSTETVKTEKDGTVTTNVAAADGSKSETVVDKRGVQSSEVKVSNKAVTEAAKAGEAVALPIPEVKASSNSSKAATVTVELPANVKTAEVEVPVANVNAGTVAVIVHADGTEEVVRNCVPTEDGIALNVANGATVKIVDNSRDFADVSAAHSFSDAVDFASARGIVEGYSNGSFGVGGYATSAATATVIARIMGEDFYGSGSTTKAQNWAKENGIAAGLDLSGNVNRVDFMTMLWRAAGSPAASTTLSFTDASSIAASAKDAMAWAVEIGLIGGYSDGSVRPEANITRGAMAAIAQRYLMAK